MNILEPKVYKAVRAVGLLRPKLQPTPQGKVFADSLDVVGTAFWLKEYRILITCAHVVRNLVNLPIEVAGLLVIGNRGNYMRASIGMLDFTHDLGVLRLILDSNNPRESEGILRSESDDGLEIVNEYPTVGAEVAYAGFPLGQQLLNSTKAPTYAAGVIGAQIRDHGQRKDIQISGAATGGFSGSPVVLKGESEKVVGVVSHSPSKEAGQASIFMAVSWEHVKAIAELNRQ